MGQKENQFTGGVVMPRIKNPKYIITMQLTNGGAPKVSFEVTPTKAQKIIDIIQSDIEKSHKKKKCSSITLDMFFTEEI